MTDRLIAWNDYIIKDRGGERIAYALQLYSAQAPRGYIRGKKESVSSARPFDISADYRLKTQTIRGFLIRGGNGVGMDIGMCEFWDGEGKNWRVRCGWMYYTGKSPELGHKWLKIPRV